MEFKFEINDEVFESTFRDGLESLSDDTKKEIMIEGFKNFVNSEKGKDMIKDQFISKGYSYYGGSSLTTLGEQIIGKALAQDEEFRKVMAETLHEVFDAHEKEILVKSIKEIIVSGFTNSYSFQDSLRGVLQSEITASVDNILRGYFPEKFNN